MMNPRQTAAERSQLDDRSASRNCWATGRRPATLVQAANWLAEERPDFELFSFVRLDSDDSALTCAAMWERSNRVAGWLQAKGVGAGRIVAISLSENEDILLVFMGALLVGAVPAIFPHLPAKVDPDVYRQRMESLLDSSGASHIVVPAGFEMDDRAGRMPGLDRVIELPPAGTVAGPTAALPPTTDNPVAALQYSSGTTGRQKGIELAHQSILDHHESLYQAIDLRPDDRVVSWLPLHHDMGLICSVVVPVLSGVPATMMSTSDWVRSPALLLKVISRQRATLCWMPNFAFNHTMRSLRKGDAGDIDLRSIRRWYNASEPVRASTIRAFAERFEPFGLDPAVLGVGYGLAEIGAVSVTKEGAPARVDHIDRKQFQEAGRATSSPGQGNMTVVSCGRLVPQVQLQIRDEHGSQLPERAIGQIHLQSPFMFRGYYRRPDLTAQAFDGGWLRTGDLGYLADGELFVTGRIKDLMIIAGKNIYPEDVEAIANEVPGVYPGRAAAFSAFDEALGSDGIIVVYEARSPVSDEDRFALERELRRQVLQELDVTLQQVELVPRGWVEKASSGKIARSANQQKYQQLTAGRSGPP